MAKKLFKLNTLIVALALVIFSGAAFGIFFSLNVSDAAQLTDPDVPSTQRNYDAWQFDPSYLNIASVKEVISGWSLPDKNAPGFRPILIGVIDTGISGEHELFSKTLLRATYDDNGSQVTRIVGYNSGILTAPNDITDISTGANPYHGSHVAGIISTLILEFGLEDYIKIVPIRAANAKGEFTLTAVANAIDWACGKNTLKNKLGYELKCDVVNLSFGIHDSERTGSSSWKNIAGLKTLIESYSDETVFVAAAGNKGKNITEDAFYPAAIPEVVSVMAYGKDSGGGVKLLTSSNYGYDILAPGDAIRSATQGVSTYGVKSGTSMAAPYVSLGAALVKLRYMCDGVNPEAEVTAGRISKFLRKHIGKTHIENDYQMRVLSYLSLVTSDMFDPSLYDIIYADPTSITLDLGQYTETVNAGESIKFWMSGRQPVTINATINPKTSHNPALDDTLEWYIEYKGVKSADTYGEKELVGKGLSYTFPPTYKGGYYRLYAELRYDHKTLKSDVINIEIKYLPLNFEKIYVAPLEWISNYSGNGKDVPAFQFTPITLSLTGMEYSNKDVPIEWYVNGKLAGSGLEFTYTPSSMGRQVITVKVDGYNVIKPFVLDVKGPFFLSYLFTALSVAAAAAFAVSMAMTKKVYMAKKKEALPSDALDENTDGWTVSENIDTILDERLDGEPASGDSENEESKESKVG